MSNPKYVNKGNKLGKFIEECGEALAAAGKTVRFGWNSYNPEPDASGERNEDWLRREIADLEEAIMLLKKSRNWGIGVMSKKKRMESIGYCISCKSQLSVCGVPFTAELGCPKCGAVNIYENSQQPKYLKGAA
jgi:hypothetical protein